MESEAFCTGVAVGINLHQQKVVMASERKDSSRLLSAAICFDTDIHVLSAPTSLKIGDELYYVQNGRERLQEMIEKICK